MRKAAMLRITEPKLRELLGIRDDVVIRAVELDPFTQTFKILLEGDSLYTTVEGCVPPHITDTLKIFK